MSYRFTGVHVVKPVVDQHVPEQARDEGEVRTVHDAESAI